MHTNSNNSGASGPVDESIIASLRILLPARKLRLREALVIAETQAEHLLRLCGITEPPVPSELVTGLPRILVELDPDLPGHAASGASDWDSDRKSWVIAINPDEPATRQRFTMLHELKHILDHYHPGLTGYLPATHYGLEPVEYIAEYFAGCVLMPRRWVKAAFADGIQRLADLAELFDVSTRAMEVRLAQLRLSAEPPRPSDEHRRYRPQPKRRRYYRSANPLPALCDKEPA